jgi:catechol 2,3-dioxygenase-like lactoylglutathione lyase family enzyme
MRAANWEVAAMRGLFTALFLVSSLAGGTAMAQPYQPNEAGVTMGHWHLNSSDPVANKKLFVAMGGVDSSNDRFQAVTFPGVLINMNLGGGGPPATGGSVGSVVNHVGFIVKNVPESVAKWKAAGVPVLPGNNGRTDQAYVVTPDGLRIEILENKDQKEPIRHEHVHFFVPQDQIPAMQAWYAKIFGAKPSTTRTNAPVDDVPGAQLRFNKADAAQAPTKGRVLDHIGFDVVDLQAFVKKLEAEGIKLDRPYSKAPNGIGLAFITDPWGTYIEINERPKAVYLP